MINPGDVASLTAACERELPLSSKQLGDEYFYGSLPLCVIDAVYSIGVRYEGVRNVVARFCEHASTPKLRADRSTLPSPEAQLTMSAFIGEMQRLGARTFADDVFKNHQRTSTQTGILKADAVLRFATVVRDQGVERFQDVPRLLANPAFEAGVLAIPGQRSGISLQYFFMLAGSDDVIKPDRMVLRFLAAALGREVGVAEAAALLVGACARLQGRFPTLTPRLLDHQIWDHQRAQAAS